MALFFCISIICAFVSPDKYRLRKAKHATVGKKILEFEKNKEKRKIYAGIDMNSNPGNCTVEDPKTYENDTSAAPGLQLELAEARE